MADTLLAGAAGEEGTAAPAGSAPATTSAPEAKAAPEAEKTQGEQAGEEGQAEADAAPLDVKLPDGVEADPDLLGALRTVAKESGLKGEHAQQLADAYVAAQQRAEAKSREAWEQQQQAWVQELKAAKDFGGGAFDRNVQVANRAIERFGSKELREVLNATGLGNHPEVLRFALRVGKALAEDSIGDVGVGATPQAPTLETALRARYSNSPDLK